MKITLAFVMAVLALILGGAVNSQDALAQGNTSEGRAPAASVNGQDNRSLQLQQDRLNFDMEQATQNQQLQRDRLALDERKRVSDESIERLKAIGTVISTIVPILAALGTIVFGIWNFSKQAKLQFEMKAAELAFSRETPLAVLNRAKALKNMFGNRLPRNFTEGFNLAEVGGNKKDPEARKKFLELLLQYPDRQQDIARLWKALFNDDWLKKVDDLQYSLGKNRLQEELEDKRLFIELMLNHPDKRSEIAQLWEHLFRNQWLEKVKTILEPSAGQARSQKQNDPEYKRLLLEFVLKNPENKLEVMQLWAHLQSDSIPAGIQSLFQLGAPGSAAKVNKEDEQLDNTQDTIGTTPGVATSGQPPNAITPADSNSSTSKTS